MTMTRNSDVDSRRKQQTAYRPHRKRGSSAVLAENLPSLESTSP